MCFWQECVYCCLKECVLLIDFFFFLVEVCVVLCKSVCCKLEQISDIYILAAYTQCCPANIG